ncbi:MAG: biotin/lipoyl-binding protein, partial [Clostridia bacterium]|nr:biotin/lipoyl-binding protein [Deltaproteobacteria bacterium]
AVIDAKSGGPQADAPGPQMARRATTGIEIEETLRHRLVWLMVALVVAIGGGGGLYWFARKGGVFASPIEARVVTLEVTKIPLYYAQSAASIRPLKEKQVGFPDRGTVEDVKVKQGDHVLAGDVLATLELPPVQQKQVNTVRTLIGKFQAQYDKIAIRVAAIDEERKAAEDERDAAFEKIRELQPKLLLNQGVTVRDINQQKMARNIAVKKIAMIAKKGKPTQNQASAMSVKLQLAKNRLRTLEQGLSNHVVKAPFTGNVVSAIAVKQGEQVSASTKLLTLRDESEAVLSFDIPGKVALKNGDDVLISVDGGAPAKGKVSATTDNDASVHIELGIPDPSGMFAMMAPAKFRIVREQIDDAFRIPTSAIAKSEVDAKARVFVAAQGRAIPRDIEIVERDAAHAVIRDPSSTLKDGDKIVAATVETGDVSGITDGTFLKTTE